MDKTAINSRVLLQIWACQLISFAGSCFFHACCPWLVCGNGVCVNFLVVHKSLFQNAGYGCSFIFPVAGNFRRWCSWYRGNIGTEDQTKFFKDTNGFVGITLISSIFSHGRLTRDGIETHYALAEGELRVLVFSIRHMLVGMIWGAVMGGGM